MNARQLGLKQVEAAYIADISERTGQRIDAGVHRPNIGTVKELPNPRDPLAGVWENELEPMLRRDSRLQPMTLYEYLQEQYPGQYEQVLRTLQRRVKAWKVIHGPSPEVMFELRHTPGVMGLSDFTELKGMTITIAGEPFEHLLYHYRLSYSGWQYAQIIPGGESFIALSEGLQNALHASGGVPKEHRTDSLSAAYRNMGGHRNKRLTQLYDDLCDHYRMEPTRNNTGIAHENGAIESPHGHLKNRIKQAIYLRGSADFQSIEEYQALINEAVDKLNRQHQAKYEEEKASLQPLPNRRVADYELLTAKVSSRSTIEVRSMLYTVPSRLIGQRLDLHLYHDRILGYFSNQQVFELPRIRATGDSRRGRCINYRHVIEGLRKKPRAFLYCTWQQELLPNPQFRQIWDTLQTQMERDRAVVLMVEALYIAATQDQEAAVAAYLDQALKTQSLSLKHLKETFSLTQNVSVPSLEIEQHPLESYDILLTSDDTPAIPNAVPESELVAQTTEACSDAQPLGGYRIPSFTGTVVVCQIFTCFMRGGSTTTHRQQAKTGTQRSSTASRKKFFQL